jgi:fatty-acyl-CoA synthase
MDRKGQSGVPPRPRGGQALQAWLRALSSVRILEQAPDTTLPTLLEKLADAHGDRLALLGEGDNVSYRALAARANRVARWASAKGFEPGAVICLLMPNCPDYVAIWLGLTRAQCVVALVNTNLISDTLLHSIRVAGSNHLIVAERLLPAVAAIADRLLPETRVWVHGASADGRWPRFEPQVDLYSGAPLLDAESSGPTPEQVALLIYTSGTTGNPKAARVSHGRVVEWSFWFAGMMDVQPDDRMYDCLPLYHSTGGIVAIGAMLVRGGSVLVRDRFSASRLWDDVAENGCSIFQYIGELCRYLVASSPHPRERQHRLRLACGNGLQAEVWTAFAERFGVPEILEFYAATEGSVSLYNCEGKPGAIGRVPPFLAHRFPTKLVRCDAETGLALRDADGRCIPCGADEVGEAIGLVFDGTRSAGRTFDGYTDDVASEQKLLRDVFAKGDVWFRTGDLMRMDRAGYFYFIDRIGDTFRWKGENVATSEVITAIRGCPGVKDAVAYGVIVPGHEGRAGMAAITTDPHFDISNLHAHLSARLPDYAQPVFVRITAALDLTGTFKLAKGRLMREGYTAATDTVWFNDREAGRYVASNAGLVRSIEEGKRRL